MYGSRIAPLLALLLFAILTFVPMVLTFRLSGQVIRNSVERHSSCFHGKLTERKQNKISGYIIGDVSRTRMHAIDQDIQKHRKIPLPFMGDTVGITGRWKEIEGNFILEPPADKKPVAIVHFLGDAFVGAAPHLSYRYLLESLAEHGLIIVATPYRLDLDHLRTCDAIISKFGNASTYLQDVHGSLPVIGMGHSGGALLHTLLSSLFPNDKRDLNVLISFNNRPAAHAIPAFHELVIPLSKRIMSEQFPSNSLRRAASFMRRYFDMAVDLYSESSLSPTFVSDEILPLMKQGFELFDQVPPLLKDIANGQEEFSPCPSHIQEVIKMMYRAKKTLLVQFESDRFDGTMELEKLLKESNTIMRMKLLRSLDKMEVERRVFNGTHSTPLIQNLLLEINPSGRIPVPETYNNLRQKFQATFMKTVTDLSNQIATFILQHHGGNEANKLVNRNSNAFHLVDPLHKGEIQQKQSSTKRIQENISSLSQKYEDNAQNRNKESEFINFHSEAARRRAANFLEERLKIEKALREERRPINVLKTTTKTAIKNLKNASVSLFNSAVKSMTIARAIVMKTAAIIGMTIVSTFFALWAAVCKATKEGIQQAKLVSQQIIVYVRSVANAVISFARNLPNEVSLVVASAVSVVNTFIANVSQGFMKGIRVLTALAMGLFNIVKFFVIFIFRSIWIGIMHVTRTVTDATGGMMHAMIGPSMMNSVQVMGENVQQGLHSMLSGMSYAVSRLSSHVFTGLQTIVSALTYIPRVLFNTMLRGNLASELKYVWNRGTFAATMYVGQLMQSVQSFLSNPVDNVYQGVVQPISSIRSEDVYKTGMTLLQQFIIALYIYFLPSS